MVITESKNEIVPVLANICNASFTQGSVPDDWREENVAPVLKNERIITLHPYPGILHL